MKVLLLGATGLLGHNVLQRLLAEGHRVVVLVRRRRSLRIPVTGFEVLESPSFDNDALLCAAEGCEAVVNCAGVTDMSLLHLEDYLGVNRDLCVRVIAAMKHHGIRRLVHVSTVNTIGHGTESHPADESQPMRPPFADSFYARSKRLGEEVVQEGMRDYPGMEAVIINPGYMLGAYDVKPSSGRMLLAAYRKPLMFAPRGGKAFVHVADVAQAAVNALERGVPGNRYIVVNSQACMSIKELYRLQAAVCGYRQRVVTAPDWLLLAAGRVGNLLRLMGVKTQVSTCNIRQLLVCEYYDNHHGLCDLGFSETPIADAIRDFHSWKNKQTEI